MSTAATIERYTPEDLLAMPDGDRYELVGGRLVEQPVSLWSSYVAGKLHHRLESFCAANRSGWALPEGTSYQCFPREPTLVRRADVSFIRLERLSPTQALAEGHVHLAPDLAAEVVSPNDTVYELEQKVLDYLAAGVRLVWVVNPQSRTVRVHRTDGSVSQLRETDDLNGEAVLPGFRCRIQELFAPPAGQSPPPSAATTG
jgi:Uma2 family endonuclease